MKAFPGATFPLFVAFYNKIKNSNVINIGLKRTTNKKKMKSSRLSIHDFNKKKTKFTQHCLVLCCLMFEINNKKLLHTINR